MLILSRKTNESIVISGGIRITVASVRGRYVRLGIEAPRNVQIHREELRSGELSAMATVAANPVQSLDAPIESDERD